MIELKFRLVVRSRTRFPPGKYAEDVTNILHPKGFAAHRAPCEEEKHEYGIEGER
jgi:hypothetical protein